MSAFTSPNDDDLPFPRDIHYLTPKPSIEEGKLIVEMREKLELDSNSKMFKTHGSWLTNETCMRFLIARNMDVEKSTELIKSALQWREKRKPAEIEKSPLWLKEMSLECSTGKVYCPAYDRYNRPVLVFDSTVQNTADTNGHMQFLAWNLEFATRLCKPQVVDKYLVFIHLNNFTLFNSPPLSSTRETIHMLCNCFPERLGHCIVFQPPAIFRTFFNGIKGWLDQKTVSKMVFIVGDVSAGSDNDKKMIELIGAEWRTITGAEQPELKTDPSSLGPDSEIACSKAGQKCSPGYSHVQYWKTVIDRLDALDKGNLHG